MTKGTFEPLRVLAELNALGVRYVLVGDLAAGAPEVPDTADSVEICVADDVSLRPFDEAQALSIGPSVPTNLLMPADV